MSLSLPIHFNDVDFQRQQFLESVQTSILAQKDGIQKALLLAERAHDGQTRDDGHPYVIHPIRVAKSLLEEIGEREANILAAALLHDVVEDTRVTVAEIQEQFGPRIAELVNSVTRPRAKEETEHDKFTTKPKNYQKILTSSTETIRIKAMDILDNMRGWVAAEQTVRLQGKLPRWLHEARLWYIPIGEKAGNGVAQEMREIVAYFEK